MSPAEGQAIPIRPHHGMCLAFFQGHGYSDGFTRHMGAMLEVFLTNPTVRLTAAPDEICSACPNRVEGGCVSGDRVIRHDRAVLEQCGLQDGDTLPFLAFVNLVQTHIIAPGDRSAICGGCQWEQYCHGPGRWAALEQQPE